LLDSLLQEDVIIVKGLTTEIQKCHKQLPGCERER